MAIRYALYPHKLKNQKEGSLVAKVITGSGIDIDEVIDRMSERGSTITKADALGAINDFFSVVEGALKDGNSVNLPLVHFRPTIKGFFADEEECFRNGMHELTFTASAGKKLKKLSEGLKMEKCHGIRKQPLISSIEDFRTKKIVKTLSSGMLLDIKGSNFVFPKGDHEAGVYIYNHESQIKAKILDMKSSHRIWVELPSELPQSWGRIKIISHLQNHTGTIRCISDPYDVS